jgi:hypothetical protein
MKKIIALLICTLLVQSASYAAFDLNFDTISNDDPIKNKFSVVHFTLPDGTTNNFQGGFFWLPTQQLVPAQAITFNGVTKTCSKRVRGLYFTNAKWSRLWPLDQTTLNGLKLLNPDYSNLQINGGLYTTCGWSGSTELYSIYGQISYTDTATSTDLGTVSAGMMYNVTDNTVDTSLWLYQTLQYFNNQTPLWYVFDNVWGIGFVGWQLPTNVHTTILDDIKNNGWYINSIFHFNPTQDIVATVGWNTTYLWWNANAGMDTIWNISVLWNVLLSRGWLDVADRQSVLGNPGTSSSVVFSDVINTADILNSLRKNSDTLCRGQTKITAMTLDTINDYIATLWYKPKVICVYNNIGWSDFNTSYGSDDPLIIDLSDTDSYTNIEFVVKWRNVVVEWSMPTNKESLNIFLDQWNILLKNGDFATEVEGGSQTSTNYAIFDARGGVLNDYYTFTNWVVNPQINKLPAGSNTPNWHWNSTNFPQVWWAWAWNILSQIAANANAADPDIDTSEIRGTVNYGVYLRWNIFVNGLIAGADTSDQPTWIVNKYYFHGRIASLNTALDASTPRKDLINNIFGATYGWTLQPFINFSSVFQWQCLVNGFAADATGNPTNQPCKVKWDAFKFNPIVLINTWVPTKLLP